MATSIKVMKMAKKALKNKSLSADQKKITKDVINKGKSKKK